MTAPNSLPAGEPPAARPAGPITIEQLNADGYHLCPGCLCAWCAGDIQEPVRDPVEVSWLGDGARSWCSQRCRDAQEAAEILAAGNDPS